MLKLLLNMSKITEDVKIAVVGNVDAGKSSFIGTLLLGKNDDSRGSNRSVVMNHPHELESGRTSSIGYQIVGFRQDGTIINVENKQKQHTWPKIMKDATKLVTFMDLAGHEKYLGTTIHGMSCNKPDYTLIMIEGRGVRGMTKEHIMLSCAFNIPFIILVTKVDLYSAQVVQSTIDTISSIVKKTKKEMWRVREMVDIEIPLQNTQNNFVPVFTVSNVTGEGMDIIKNYLARLSTRIDYTQYRDEPCEIAVTEGFTVQGIGVVAHGFVTRGTIHVGDVVWVGPDGNGKYHKSKVRSIQYKRISVDFVLAGHHCTLALPGIDRQLLRSGVYVLHDSVTDKGSVNKFTADVKVFSSHPVTMKEGYCPVINIDNVRVAVRVKKIFDVITGDRLDYVRGDQKARVEFQFMYRPARIKMGTTFVFREGRTRGVGKVLDIIE